MLLPVFSKEVRCDEHESNYSSRIFAVLSLDVF